MDSWRRGFGKEELQEEKKAWKNRKKLRTRKISINLDKNQFQLRTIEGLIKFDFENDLFEKYF